jgi:multiple sugar transport system substrate-binding protein
LIDKLAALDLPMKPQPTIEPLADGWAGQLLLGRAAAYVTHRDQVSALFDYPSLQPLIATPPYVRALDELVAANRHAPRDQRFTPSQAMEELFAGRAVMVLACPAPQRLATKDCDLPLGFGPVPGSAESYNFATGQWERREMDDPMHVPLLATSGRLGAVTSTATRPREAQDFLAWVAGRDVSVIVGPTSAATTLFRDSHLAAPQRWTAGLDAAAARSFGDAIKQSSSLPRYLSLTLPGREEYLQALDAAVHQALAGDAKPAEALAAAGRRWQEITSGLGLERQQQALRRCLGMEGLQ